MQNHPDPTVYEQWSFPPKKYTFLLGVSAHKRTPAHAPPRKHLKDQTLTDVRGGAAGAETACVRARGGPMGP